MQSLENPSLENPSPTLIRAFSTGQLTLLFVHSREYVILPCRLQERVRQAALSEVRQSRTGHANRLRQAKTLFDLLFAATSDGEQAAQ